MQFQATVGPIRQAFFIFLVQSFTRNELGWDYTHGLLIKRKETVLVTAAPPVGFYFIFEFHIVAIAGTKGFSLSIIHGSTIIQQMRQRLDVETKPVGPVPF